MSSVRVPVINDSINELSEEFNLVLHVSASLGPAITAGGRDAAVGIITPSGSMYRIAHTNFGGRKP